MKRLLALMLFSVCTLCAQGSMVRLTDAPGDDEHTRIVDYASATVQYVCHARTFGQPADTKRTVTYSSISNAAAAVVSATDHGFSTSSAPMVFVSGGTGNWAALNTTTGHKITVIDANSFSIPVNSTSFGAVTGTIVISSTAPRTNQPVWKVQKVIVDGSSRATNTFWAPGGYNNKCSDRATLSFQ